MKHLAELPRSLKTHLKVLHPSADVSLTCAAAPQDIEQSCLESLCWRSSDALHKLLPMEINREFLKRVSQQTGELQASISV